jgi:hypothetical protein
MSENLKSGLLILIAGLLVVNTVLLVKNGTPTYADPSEAKATFERVADTKPKTNAKIGDDAADLKALDPMAAASDKPVGPTTSISFNETSHDFGTINQDSENKKIFSFTNTGSEPLIIENAKGSCGCTVPKYPKEPIAPGETGEIEVVYKPGKQKNKQTKNVTITANTDPAKTVLTITAEVLESAS